MKKSIFWRMIGMGMLLGLVCIGYELSANHRVSPPSFSSAAYADETTPEKPAAKIPKLDFTPLKVPAHPDLRFERAKVAGGWMLLVSRRTDTGETEVEGFTFYPDPNHKWDGGSMEEKAEIRQSREEAPRRIFGPPFNAAGAAAKAMELFDSNKDGKISGDELDQAPGLKAALKVMATDKDKGVTADQISLRVKKWIDSKIGRTSLSCMVIHNGQPLAGATVKFVPEKFLSEYLTETATGKTNQTGMAMLSVPVESGPDAFPPGLPVGMYRVEITKDGENIPAKYNTETTLGQEVSLDNIEMQMGIKYNLKY
jgi:hypothetical protein